MPDPDDHLAHDDDDPDDDPDGTRRASPTDGAASTPSTVTPPARAADRHERADPSGPDQRGGQARDRTQDRRRVTGRDHRPVRSPAVAQVAVGDELVITHPRARRAVRLDPVTARLWQWFQPGLTVGELADDVADALDLDPDEAMATLGTIVHDLSVSGFLDEPGDDALLAPTRFAAVPPDT